jgi:hypothetical protein
MVASIESRSLCAGLTIIPLVLFEAAGIAITLVFPRFDASMPAQLLAP